ncbi:MAG: hypothetical protein ABIL40_09660 [candidate division WOR-3 bacterium]
MKKAILYSVIFCLVLISLLYSSEGLWTSIGGPPGGYSRAADFCPPPFTEIYASSDSFLYVSTDNGLTWQITAHPKTEIYDIKIGKMGSNYCIFTATSDGIYRSFGNTSWQLVYEVATSRLAVDRNICSYIYAISNAGIVRSTDLGISWTIIHPTQQWQCIAIDPFSPQTIFIGHRTKGL